MREIARGVEGRKSARERGKLREREPSTCETVGRGSARARERTSERENE